MGHIVGFDGEPVEKEKNLEDSVDLEEVTTAFLDALQDATNNPAKLFSLITFGKKKGAYLFSVVYNDDADKAKIMDKICPPKGNA